MKTPNTTDLLHDLRVENRKINGLKPYKGNARTHSKKQVQQIANSMQTFGFVSPVLISEDNTIIAGHGRVEAAKLLGMDEVPSIQLSHLSDAERRAYVLADNRLAELAGWDKETLTIELQHLLEIDAQFDITVTGFETGEIDFLVQEAAPEADPDDELPDATEMPTVTRPGDCWQLGEHRLLCGDALEQSSYTCLMGDERARIVFTDPPYNVPIQGHVGGLGAVTHPEFAMASGEMSEAEFTGFLSRSLKLSTQYLVDGGLLYVCMDWRHASELLNAAISAQLSQLNLCVWNKDNGGMGSFYRSKHELVFVFKYGKASHINNVELGKHGRYRTNVWDYPGVNSFHKGRDEALQMHPTVKPVSLVADAILDSTLHNEIVLDIFGGSGTTLIAAERVGRRARLMELEPRYVDVTLRRWELATGQSAIHIDTGLSFDELALQRNEEQLSCPASTTTEEVQHGQ